MSMNMNRVDLIGRLGKEPEFFQFSNGGEKVSLSVATSERWQDKTTKEWKEKTQWHNVVSTSTYAVKVSRGLSKGNLVRVCGVLEYRQYEKDGATKYITEIIIPPFSGSLDLLEKRNGSADSYSDYDDAPNVRLDSQQSQALDELSDEIPF